MGQACTELEESSAETSQHTCSASSSHDALGPTVPTPSTPRVPTTLRGASVVQRWSVRDYQRLQQQQADADARFDQWRQSRRQRSITMGSTQYQETTAHEGHVPSDDAEVSYSESDLHSVENSASDLQQMQRRFGQPVVGFLALHPTGSLGTVESHATSVGCGDSASDTSPRQRSHYFKRSPPYENSQGVNPLRSQSSPRSSTPTQHRSDTMKLSFKEDPAQRIRTPSVGFLALHPTCKEESS